MTFMDIFFFALLPSAIAFLIGCCIADHARRWEALTEEEQAEDYEQSIW
jgi:outer membrane biogenesis lipoprotein LolB